MSGVRAVIVTQTTKKSGGSFPPKAAPQPRSHMITIQQNSSSGTTTAVLQALAFVRVITMYECMCGWRTAAGDRTTTTTVSPTTQQSNPYTKLTAAENAVAHACNWNACVPPFRLATPPRYQVYEVNPIPKGNLVQHMFRTTPNTPSDSSLTATKTANFQRCLQYHIITFRGYPGAYPSTVARPEQGGINKAASLNKGGRNRLVRTKPEVRQ